MCGIIGYLGPQEAGPIILDGLRRLEYRGYDSAGISVVAEGKISTIRSEGKLKFLTEKLTKQPLRGTLGIGHTRWATHGRPSEKNAHPHTDCRGTIVVVHNGIIENYTQLKKEMKGKHLYASETDTEVLAHLIEEEYQGKHLLAAVQKALKKVHGSYALVVMSAKEPDRLVVARSGSPLVIGLGEGETFVASDVPAFLLHTREVVFLNDQETGQIDAAGLTLYNAAGKKIEPKTHHIAWDPVQAEKEGYKHFMQKEIFEQPRMITDTVRGRLRLEGCGIYLEELDRQADLLTGIGKVALIACGTSWHAALVGKFWIEELARLPVEVDYASEFRYRSPLVDTTTLAVAISQSGETADTLAAVREAKNAGAKTVAICNVVGSSITRDSLATIYTHAGPEIGVASTKAFTAQLTVLYLLALYLGRKRGAISDERFCEMATAFYHIPQHVETLLKNDARYLELANLYYKTGDFLYLGRGINYPIALEGALKLKEISYIHAEGYPAGEMKHGPIALIDETMPVVVIATASPVREKIIGNIKEVKARGGTVIALVSDGDREISGMVDEHIRIPKCHHQLSPLLNVVPLQLLAYHIAVKRGCDVDQPRNLAKSVTVE